MKKVGKKELFDLILEEVISLDEERKQITDEQFDNLLNSGFNYGDFEKNYLNLLKNDPPENPTRPSPDLLFKLIKRYITGEEKSPDAFKVVIDTLLRNLPIKFSDEQRLKIYDKFYKDHDPANGTKRQKSPSGGSQDNSKPEGREIDQKFQDALKKYDEKRAEKRKKITDQTKKAEFDQKTKTVRNAFIQTFENKFPKWEPSDESKKIIDVDEEFEKFKARKKASLSTGSRLVIETFPEIDQINSPMFDNKVFLFLSSITDSLLKSFESPPLIDDEELQEGFSGSNVQKLFRKVMFKDTTLADANKFYKEFIMSIMEPINKAGIEYVQSTQGESSVKYIKNVVYKSKETFEQAQENLIKSLGGNFNERIGKVSRYARKIGVEEFKSRLTKLGEAIAEKIDFGAARLAGDRFQKLYGVDERKDSLLRKLGELFKSQSLSEEIELPELDPERSQMRNPEEIGSDEDPFSDPEITPPDEKTDQLAMLLMNSYGRNVDKEKVISILTQIQDAFEYRVDYKDLEKAFKEMGIPKKEKEEGEKPYYFIDENEVIEKFAKIISQRKSDAGIDEAKTKLDSSFKVFVELYSDEDYFMIDLREKLNPFEIETLIWYLSDKKRFASFMNKYFKNDSLYQKAIKLKSPIFKKLFSNIKNLRFDAEGEIFDLEKKILDDYDSEKEMPGLNYQLSDRSKVKKEKTGWEVSPFKDPLQIRFEEAIKPIVEETILEMLGQ